MNPILRSRAHTMTRRAMLATSLFAVAARAGSIDDARGRPIDVSNRARVVCIGGAITEVVYALGQAGSVVAVDSTSQFPADALRDKRNIGYMRALSPEGVLSVDPTLLLVARDSGPPQAIDVLRSSRVPMLFVDSTPTAQAVLDRVRFLAGVFQVTEQGEQLCRTIQAGFDRLASWRASHLVQQRVLFILSLQNDRPVVGGAGTSADAIIALAGGINAASSLSGYKPISNEAVTELAPDVVLAMGHAGPGIDDAVLQQPAFRLTTAGQKHNLIRMDGELLLGFGPRTPEAALELAQRLADAARPA